ncbi:ModE family transcriptional regulator [Campylobacter sputorum subsp. bubulus]|uniref:ModE family transcriptional regulator n=1 Tax=Campylobacter sputorum subsp. sputorum TaxID=32024 RepID=A0A381DL90_9BACT|nr:TOBE domain-containing protein [Campylobacter sputorum]ASM34749.1 molybdenum-pterin binding domain-containing protein [Campylobacter sputorum aubsp. sputorum RM3237]ASM36410.1 molybdenum-pterin binding domain-containing protein [Campylobacter sputorum bv. faecalis CCUG 20703]KAB0581694.1 ModE family transcriptional regulator [Campylobacter sputorum subsp. sputorum]QEL04940.1 molybdenum-pterin binding domain-containing protein [Campylobacter sputorum subsp. sputorum]SUX10033.1 ModE family tr
MKIGARNQIKTQITEIKTGSVNSLISAKSSCGKVFKATVTVESEKNLDLKVGKEAYFIFKAINVIISKDNSLKFSATNQITGKVKDIELGDVMSKITINSDGLEISSVITKESTQSLNLKQGDSVTAMIKATNIIVGVK